MSIIHCMLYLTVSGITILSLKSIGQFYYGNRASISYDIIVYELQLKSIFLGMTFQTKIGL